MSDVILSVRELTEELRRSLEGRFPFVWVRGEVTNLTRPGSGHVYFSLKDQDAQLQCVWFRQRQGRGGQAFDPLTGQVCDAPRPAPVDLLRNGLDVLCAGRISVYAPRGQYQLAVELAQPAGEGLLAQAFEERKRKLAALGYFAAERKRGLPWDPQRVALITSPTGARKFAQAAEQDIRVDVPADASGVTVETLQPGDDRLGRAGAPVDRVAAQAWTSMPSA